MNKPVLFAMAAGMGNRCESDGVHGQMLRGHLQGGQIYGGGWYSEAEGLGNISTGVMGGSIGGNESDNAGNHKTV